jgi:membrane glycosyltransferase
MAVLSCAPSPEPIRLPESALPPDSPMAMPVQDLKRAPVAGAHPGRDRYAGWLRFAVFAGAALLAAALVREMYLVLAVGGLTSIEAVMLGLFVVNIAWISFAFVTAVAGTLALATGRAIGQVPASAGRIPKTRTAILIPTYNENPVRVFATAAATSHALTDAGAADAFDIFVLSDTTDPDTWIGEEAAFRAVLSLPVPHARIFYRRRHQNTERKAGNIADWCRRFGAAYPAFVIFDADSIMDADTLVRMALAMETQPELGLLQTVPVVVNRNTLFARLQQFAGHLYGPIMSAGLAVWSRDAGNYWGHNAILRTEAFAGAAGLPHLPGRPPFGGHILSHDFVEAALMRRAGWAVVLAPTLRGSYEESPPSLIDLAARDRRWCQGNLQHAKVLAARGLKWPSRVHMAMGIMSYVASPVWLMFLIAGLLLALQARFIRPEYFSGEFQLFPTWPVLDSELAVELFVATMAILFLPKLFGLALALCDGAARRGIGGALRGTTSVVVESLFAALLAPIMMAIQSAAVVDILLGRDAGWQPQRRDDGTVPFGEIARRHRAHTLLGLALGASAWAVSPQVLAWMSPAVIGLVFSAPLSAASARLGVGLALRRMGLLTTPEEIEMPEILRRGEVLATALGEAIGPSGEACSRLAADPALLAFHRASLPGAVTAGRGAVNEPLILGLARIADAETIEEAADRLSAKEKIALLAVPDGLDRIASLPLARSLARGDEPEPYQVPAE